MKRNLGRVVLATAAAALLIAPLSYADQLLIGKKLLIKDKGGAKNKMVLLIKDPAVTGAVGTTSGRICLVGAGGTGGTGVPTVLDIDPVTANGTWADNGVNKAKYKRGDECKVTLIKDAKLIKAVCKGPDVDYDPAMPAVGQTIQVVVATNNDNYCAAFGDVGDDGGCDLKKDGTGGKYLSKNCADAADACAVCPASPSGAFLEVASLF